MTSVDALASPLETAAGNLLTIYHISRSCELEATFLYDSMFVFRSASTKFLKVFKSVKFLSETRRVIASSLQRHSHAMSYIKPYVAADVAPAKIGDALSAVDTPACVVDLDVVEHNMTAALRAIDGHSVLLRPHMKSHKTPGLVALQKTIARGKMVGVCCQKVNEAEAALFAGAIDNVLVTNQVVGQPKLARLASLVVVYPSSRVGVLVDVAENARDLSAAVLSASAVAGLPFAPAGAAASSSSAGCSLDVFVEVDVGQRRCGVAGIAEAVELGRLVHSLPGLRLAGVQTYHGGVQHVRAHADRAAIVASVAAVANELRAAFVAAGLPKPIVTGGGSGTFDLDVACGAFDEVQPGSFIFSDADYARNLDAAGREVRQKQAALFSG